MLSDSANNINASGFVDQGGAIAGSVTIDGGDGNDTIRGGSGDDFLTGNGGIDQIFGNAGTDTLIEEADSKFIATNSQIDMGEGGDETVVLTLSSSQKSAVAGTFTLTYDTWIRRTRTRIRLAIWKATSWGV